MGLLLPLRGHHWVALLWICLVLDTVAAVRLPGVAWSKLEVWGGSALADVWLRSGLNLRLWGAAARQWGRLFKRGGERLPDRNLNF